jgi:hypothetical protein
MTTVFVWQRVRTQSTQLPTPLQRRGIANLDDAIPTLCHNPSAAVPLPNSVNPSQLRALQTATG